MLETLLLVLQVSLPAQDTGYLASLNFDPREELGVSKDSINLLALDYSSCTEIKIRYPVGIQRFFGVARGRTVRTQDCFYAGTDSREKLVIVTYYDATRNIGVPIAFVHARVRVDSSGSAPKRVSEERWGIADLGFVQSGRVDRVWLPLLPREEASIQNQLVELLKPGFDRADKP